MDVPGCEVITLPVEKTSRSCPRQTRAPGVPQKGVRGVPNPREKVPVHQDEYPKLVLPGRYRGELCLYWITTRCCTSGVVHACYNSLNHRQKTATFSTSSSSPPQHCRQVNRRSFIPFLTIPQSSFLREQSFFPKSKE
ncbi:hypothetical protein RUM44_003756 [Polyplax serrata]|uniref:Uncharacterized protein n=1 Tax=Polyplax serrata TaxID=468196 RepID=A0ABR1AIU6_POLSC